MLNSNRLLLTNLKYLLLQYIINLYCYTMPLKKVW